MGNVCDTGVCPGCSRHCSLDAPRCHKGKEFAKTCKLSTIDSNEPEHMKHGIRSGEVASEDEKLSAGLRACGHYIRHRGGDKGSQRQILSALLQNGKMMQHALKEMLDVKSGPLGEMVSKLEADGFVALSADRKEKHSVEIDLTEAGKTAAATRNGLNGDADGLFSMLSAEEKAQLSMLVDKLLAQWGASNHGYSKKDSDGSGKKGRV